MEHPVMKALVIAASELITAFARSAAKQGFSIMLLIITNVGFILWVDAITTAQHRERLEHRAEIAELRNEYRADIARLRTVVDSLRIGLDDCNEARIRVEGQNAALMKQKR